MRSHGMIAVPGVFLLGWLSAAHIVERWRRGRRLVSGIAITVTAALLVISGYALYYLTDRPHAAAALIHEAVGVAAIVLALAHWYVIRPT